MDISGKGSQRKANLMELNKVQLSPTVVLEGQTLEDYCKKRGLCPLCAKTKTCKRAFNLFKRNTWEPLTVLETKGGDGYAVYKGYCLKPNCFTLEQAKRLVGESVELRPEQSRMIRRPTRTRSVMKGLGVAGKEFESTDLEEDSSGKSEAFPPPDLKNGKYKLLPEEPLFVIQKTVEMLQQDLLSIQKLDLSGIELRTMDVKALADALPNNTTIQALVMESCKLTNIKIEILARGLDDAKDNNLKQLYLRGNQIGDDGIGALCKFLQGTGNLEKLDVSRNSLSTNGAISIFKAFHQNRLSRIKLLNFSHNELWDLEKGEFGIETFLARNRSLRVLNLEGNYIHDDGAQAIAKGIEKNVQSPLERLYLGWNSIGDDGTIALADMLEVNTSLRLLILVVVVVVAVAVVVVASPTASAMARPKPREAPVTHNKIL